jgi:hypothetical protein
MANGMRAKCYHIASLGIILPLMIFEIATFRIKIRLDGSDLFNFQKLFEMDYVSFICHKKDHYDFIISVIPYNNSSLEAINFVRRQSHFYYEGKKDFIIKSRFSTAYINPTLKRILLSFKNTCSGRKKINLLMAYVRLALSICTVLKGGLPFHSSAISFGNCGIAFSGPSGAGKTTIAKLLISPGELLNDDFNILLPCKKNGYKIYSTPFTKTLKNCFSRSVKLRAVFFLEKGTINKIETLPFKNKFLFTVKQTVMFPLSDYLGNKILDNVENICAVIEFNRLRFVNNKSIRPFIYRFVGGST